MIYAVLFTVEVLLRVLSSGCLAYLWNTSDWAWNCLDLFVVTSSWLELLLQSVAGGSSMSGNRNLRVLRLLRFGRLVRVVRVVRVARLFRSLRTLINSLVGTLTLAADQKSLLHQGLPKKGLIINFKQNYVLYVHMYI